MPRVMYHSQMVALLPMLLEECGPEGLDVIQKCSAASQARLAVTKHIPGKSDSGTEIVQVRIFVVWAYLGTGVSAGRSSRTAFSPFLSLIDRSEFVPQAQIQRQIRKDFVIILGIEAKCVVAVMPSRIRRRREDLSRSPKTKCPQEMQRGLWQ